MEDEFKNTCIQNLFALRKLRLHPVKKGCKKEAILYTYDDSIHIEFLLRLAILNLGEEWSHTIICGNNNRATIEYIRNCIDSNITIIQTPYSYLDLVAQNTMMLTIEFWKKFSGKLLFFYDTNTCIFSKTDELEDLSFIGNRNISLRDRDILIECLESSEKPSIGLREDVFFKRAIVQHKLGKISEVSLPKSIMWKPWLIPDWKEPIYKLLGKRELKHSNIILYILCHTQERLESAKEHYSTYLWARPILMKYQDFTFENAFWAQLKEIHNDWKNYDFVGTLSFSAFRKINLDHINRQITEGKYMDRKYVNFNCSTRKILDHKGRFHHPYFKEIWMDMLDSLDIDDIEENACNYWMCTPDLMIRFIDWHHSVMRPLVISHPLVFNNAEYGGALTPEELIALWGQPYYPHVPFIMERLNKAFFDYFATPHNN
jgi:hypothetical protein